MTNTNTTKSTGLKFAYWSLAVFGVSIFTCYIIPNLGGIGLMLSGVLGLVAFVVGLVEDNVKAWALGLICPVLVTLLFFIGLMARSS